MKLFLVEMKELFNSGLDLQKFNKLALKRKQEYDVNKVDKTVDKVSSKKQKIINRLLNKDR